MRSLNNIQSITINGNKINKIERTYRPNLKNKYCSVPTQKTTEDAIAYFKEHSNDCDFEFNNKHNTNMLFDNVDVIKDSEDDISKTVPYNIPVEISKTTDLSFDYPSDCLNQATTSTVYLSGAITGEYTKTTEVETEFEYNPTIDIKTTAGASNMTISYPEKGKIIHIPAGFFDASYTNGTTTQVVKICLTATNDIVSKLYSDPECNNLIDILDTNYITSYKFGTSGQRRYYYKTDVYLKNESSSTSVIVGVFNVTESTSTVKSVGQTESTYFACYNSATRTKFMYEQIETVSQENGTVYFNHDSSTPVNVLNVPDDIKNLIISPNVRVALSSQTSKANIKTYVLDLTDSRNNIPNAKIYFQGTCSGNVLITCDELHITKNFFMDLDFSTLTIGQFGDWSNIVAEKIYFEKNGLNTTLTGNELINKIKEILILPDSSNVYLE